MLRPLILCGFLLFLGFTLPSNSALPLGEKSKTEITQSPPETRNSFFSIVNTYFSRFLHQGTTLSVLHTSNQRLWISNYDGVLKAKGKSIQYQNELFAPTSGFSKPRIRKLVEIWGNNVLAITNSNELLMYDERRGVFEAPDWAKLLDRPNTQISDAYFSRARVLWVGLMSGEAIRVDESGKVERDTTIRFDQQVTDFYDNAESSYFLASSKNRIIRKSYKTDRIQIFDIELMCGSSAPAQEVAQLANGDIWIGTIGGGLLSIEDKTNKCRQVSSNINTQKDFYRSTVHDITVDKKTGLSIVSTDQGIFIFRNYLAVQNFTASNSKLSNNEVISVAPDHSGGYWIGTYNGINRMVLSPFELFDKQTHQRLHSVVAFESLDQNEMLVASYSGLMVTDIGSSTFSLFKDHSPNIALYGERIMSVLVDKDDIYIGYRNSGFEILHLGDSQSSRLNKEILQGLASNSISGFLKLDSGEILIGTYGGGLTIFKKPVSSKNITSGKMRPDLRDDRVLMLYGSSDGTIWVGTESGLQIFDASLNKFQSVAFASASSSKPDQPVIWSMAETETYIWFGSLHHGLFRLEKADYGSGFAGAELKHVEFSSPLPSKTVYAIEAGSQGEIWFSTNQGISRFSDDGGLLNFGHIHGLQETEFELGSSYKDVNGFIYFGGNHGYNRFDPNRVITSKDPSRIVLNSIVLDSDDISLQPIKSDIDSIILNHNDRFITFEFSALDFTDPESTRYRHKLVGFDTDWIDIGNRGSATYTSLPAGDYVFRVQAVNSAGIWNYDGLSIDLSVEPAPWLTWWAFTAYFVCLVGLVAQGLKFFRDHTLRKQQLQQADETQRAADRFADELQDQIDFQSKLNDSIDFYNQQLLYWGRFCVDSTVEYGSEVTEAVRDRILFRQGVLEIVQGSLYYQGERLYANFHDCAARLVNKICASHPQVCNRLTSVNDVQKELIPAAQALPLAIILAELFDNSLTHAFEAGQSTCFVRFAVTHTPNPGAGTDTVRMIYQDDGPGIPRGLAFESPESAGFAIIKRAGEVLGCELAIGKEDRSLVTASFQLPWSE